MRKLFLISIVFVFVSCNQEKISNSDTDKLVNNHLENNRIEIDRIKREIKEFKLEKRSKNIAIMDHLDQMHKSVLALNDSIDSVDKGIVLKRTIDFINKNFNNLETFNEVQFEINESTPRPLLKLRIATLEALSIQERRLRYDFGDEGPRIIFDHATVQIKPSKTIVKKGEKVTGELIFGAAAKFENSKKVVKKMTLNGQEIRADKDGWKFEITPKAEGTGLVEYELMSEAVLDDTTSLKGQHLIYIQN